MLDIITIGTATRDTFLSSPLFKVLRDPKHLEKIGFKTGEAECFALGSKIEIEKPVVAPGGGAVNTAVTFARQGFKTASFVRIGADADGAAILQSLKKERVSPIVVRDARTQTASSTVLLASGGERTILVYRGASEGLTRREVPHAKLRARWAYLAPGGIAYDVVSDILSTLKKHGARVAMNPSREYLSLSESRARDLFGRLDVVILNREEASHLTGVPFKNDAGIFKKLDRLVPGIAVMTDGARGALASDGKYRYIAGVFREKKLADRTGAGDAYGAGFIAGLLRTNDITHALRLAAANATAVIESVGAATGALTKKQFAEKRWRYLDLDVEPL